MKKATVFAIALGMTALLISGLSCKKGPDLSKMEPIVVALGPSFDAAAAPKQFELLQKYLETKVGKPFKFQGFKTQKEFADFVKEGKASFIYCTPIDFAEVADGCIVLCKANYPGYGSITHGVVIVKQGEAQKIRDVPAMKGSSIMVVSKNSLGGYLSQKMFFANNGLDIDLDMNLSAAPTGKNDEVVAAVAGGQVEYGCVPWDIFPDKKPKGGAEVLTTTPNVPVDVFGFVEASGDKMLGGQVKNFLKEIPKDDPMLKPLGLTSFSLGTQAEYDVVTNFLSEDKINKAQRQGQPAGTAATGAKK